MVKLTKVKPHNFILLILLSLHSTYCLSDRGLYNQLEAGKFSKDTDSFVQEIGHNDKERLWKSDTSRLEYLYTLLDNSTLKFNKKGYELASSLLLDYQSNPLTDPYFKKQIQYFFVLSYLSFTPSSERSEEAISNISDTLPQHIFTGNRIIWAYNQLIDHYLNGQKYGQAFRYSMLGLAQLVKQPNIPAHHAHSFLVRLAQTQALMGKTNHINHTLVLIDKLQNQFNILPNTPFSIDNKTRYASASTHANDLLTIKMVYQELIDQEKAGIAIPSKSLNLISNTYAWMMASSGVDYDYESIFTPIKESGYSNANIEVLITWNELLAKISRGESIGLNTKIPAAINQKSGLIKEEEFLSIDLYINSPMISEEKYIKKLTNINDSILEVLKQHATTYDFDFNNTFYVNSIIKTILLSVHSRYQGPVPEKISSILISLMETNRSELDLITKAKNIEYTHSKSKSAEIKSLLNVNKDIEYLTSQYLSQVDDNLKKQNYIEDTTSYKIRGNTLINAIKKSDYYSETNEPLVIDDVLYPSIIDLNKIQTSLDNAHLFYYKIIDQVMYSCLISNKKLNCITRIVSLNEGYTKDDLFNALTINNKNKIKTRKILNYFYNYVFEGHDYSSVKKIHLYPQEKDTTVPFAAFQDKDGIFVGEKFELSLLPSLVLRIDNSSSPNFLGEYFALANPSYGEIRSAIEDETNIFNIRSASVADDLSGLTQLPDTEIEVINASASINFNKKKLLLRDDATEYNLRTSGFENYRILHFATHGIVTGEFNGLRLPSLALSLESTSSSSSTDGLLNSNEISNLEINSDIAILSACQTLSDYGAGETGFSGLVSAFMASGVDSVLATMWKIESSSASIIAADFVQNSSSSGDYSGSLHKTYKKYIHSQKHASPFYWAPFVLVEQLKAEVYSKTNNIYSKVIVNNSKNSIDMASPNIDKNEVWTILFEDRGDGIYENFLFNLANENKIFVPTFNTSILMIGADHIDFMGRTDLKRDSNIQIYSMDKETKKIRRKSELENSKGLMKKAIAKSKRKFAIHFSNNQSGDKKKSTLSVYDENYFFEGSVDVTQVEKNRSRGLILDVLDDKFIFVVNDSNRNAKPITNLHKGYFGCSPYDNSTTSIYSIDEQMNLYTPENFKDKKIHADGFINIGASKYALWRDFCNQETIFTPLDTNSHEQITLPNLSNFIFSGKFNGKNYIAGDFRSKSSVLVDYYKEGGDSAFSFNQGFDNLVLGDEKLTFSIMIEDDNSKWSAVHFSPKDLINTTLSLKAEGDTFKRLYIDKFNSIHEEVITITSLETASKIKLVK